LGKNTAGNRRNKDYRARNNATSVQKTQSMRKHGHPANPDFVRGPSLVDFQKNPKKSSFSAILIQEMPK